MLMNLRQTSQCYHMKSDMTHGRTIYVIIKKYGMQKKCHLYTYIPFKIYNCNFTNTITLKDECPVNALRAQNLAGGHFLGPEIRLVFISLSI